MDGLVEILEGAGLKHIIMPRKAYIKEHRNLVRLLNRSNIPALKKEAADQIKEVRDATGVRLQKGGRKKEVQQPVTTETRPSPPLPHSETARDTLQRLAAGGYLDDILTFYAEDDEGLLEFEEQALDILTEIEGASIPRVMALREATPDFFERLDKMASDEERRSGAGFRRRGGRRKDVQTLEFPVQLPDVTDSAIAKFQRLWNEGYLDHIFYDYTEDEQEDMKKEAIEVLTDMEGASIHLGAVLRERHPQFFEAVDKMEEDDRARREAEEAALEAARANWAANRRGRRGKNVEAEDDDSKTGEGRRHFGTLVSRRRKDRVITPELK
jgi:hypothetical protein